MKTILLLLLITLSNCDIIQPPKKNDNSAALLAGFVLTRQSAASGCTSASTSAIANTAVTSASRTDFAVADCNASNISGINFSADSSITTGMTGTSATSRILSNGDLFTAVDLQGDRSIEVTFTLNSASAYLEVVTRATGTISSFDGSAVRITPTAVSTRGRGLTTLEAMGAVVTTPVSTSRTYCIDAHKETSGDHLIFWPTSCAAVTSKNPPFANDKDGVLAGQGNRLGFVLNGVTMTNFKVGTRTAISGNFLEP